MFARILADLSGLGTRSGDRFAALRRVFEDDGFVLGVLGRRLGMYIGWHYYSGLAGTIVAHRASPRRPLISPLLEKTDGEWHRVANSRKALVHREFLRERDYGRVGFLDVFFRQRHTFSTTLENTLKIILCEDGEVSFFLFHWCLQRYVERKGLPTSDRGLSGLVRTVGNDLSLYDDAGRPTLRLGRLQRWVTSALQEGSRHLYRRGLRRRELEDEIATAVEADDFLLRLSTKLLGEKRISAAQIAESARFNVVGHYALRRRDAGSDKSIVYFPLVMPQAPGQPGLFFVVTLDQISRTEKQNEQQHIRFVESKVDAILPYALVLGMIFFSDIMAREEGSLVRLLSSHGLRTPLAHLASCTGTLLRLQNVPSALAASLAEIQELAEDADRLVSVSYGLVSSAQRQVVVAARNGSPSLCNAQDHPSYQPRSGARVLWSDLEASVHRTLIGLMTRIDLSAGERQLAGFVTKSGFCLDRTDSPGSGFTLLHRGRSCGCKAVARARTTLLSFILPELIANAVKEASKKPGLSQLLIRIRFSGQKLAVTVAMPGELAQAFSHGPERLLVEEKPTGSRRQLGLLLCAQFASSVGWRLEKLRQAEDLVEAMLSLPTTKSTEIA